MMEKYRVHEVAKDLGVPSREVIDLLGKYFDTPKKHMTALEKDELSVVFEHYTAKNQVENFDAYFAQAVERPARKEPPVEAAEPKREVPAAAAPKAEAAAAKPAPVQSVPEPATNKAPAPQRQNDQRPLQQQRPQQGQQRPDQNRPVAQQQRPQQGQQRPDQNRPAAQQQRPQQAQQRPDPNRPAAQNQQQRPQQQQLNRTQQFQQRQQQAQQRPQQQRPQQQRPQQQQQRRPLQGQPAAPQGPVVTQVQPDQNGNVQHVDMKTVNVNLDKYNERYETIAPTNLAKKDTGVRKQKLNQRSANRKPFMSRKEKEEQKIKRLQMERERRQKLEITIPEEISVTDLAGRLKVQVSEVVKRLMGAGVMASAGEIIDYDTAALVAMEIGAKVSPEVVVTIEDRLFDEAEDSEDNLVERCPVVVVMGHVDHGKTSLLDAIRDANVTSGEAGGITQHIGAYQVEVGGRKITFLDTPGHAAFTSMRARGAQVTDIAILVVAADDGIMPQTVEAINHAKEAGVGIIVAINKMDKPEANPERIKQEMTEYELVPEEWGGDTVFVEVSAKTKNGIDTLLEMVQLVADVRELKANPDRMARGTVIEAQLDRGRGPVATILVQNGTLRTGDVIIAGIALGRVRVMLNDRGERLEEAGPSTPVEITGLSEVPNAGDIFNAVEDERLARELVDQRRHEAKQEQFSAYQKVTLDNLFSQISEGEMKELAIIVKADVQGSVEAVKQSLEKIGNEEVRVRVIHGGVGAVSESDVMLADASNAIIVGFNVRYEPAAKENADLNGVDIRLYRVIYDAINEVKDAMQGMLAPKYRDIELGRVEVRNVFKITGVGAVAGCYVLDGKITRNAQIRVVRDGIIVADDVLSSLKRFKDDVKEVAAGYECGMSLTKFNDYKEGDIFEAYEVEEYRD